MVLGSPPPRLPLWTPVDPDDVNALTKDHSISKTIQPNQTNLFQILRVDTTLRYFVIEIL